MNFWKKASSFGTKALSVANSVGKMAVAAVGVIASVAVGTVATLGAVLVDVGPTGLGILSGTLGVVAAIAEICGVEGIEGADEACFKFAGACFQASYQMQMMDYMWGTERSNDDTWLSPAVAKAFCDGGSKCIDHIKSEAKNISDTVRGITPVPTRTEPTKSWTSRLSSGFKNLFGNSNPKHA